MSFFCDVLPCAFKITEIYTSPSLQSADRFLVPGSSQNPAVGLLTTLFDIVINGRDKQTAASWVSMEKPTMSVTFDYFLPKCSNWTGSYTGPSGEFIATRCPNELESLILAQNERWRHA